MKHLTYGIKINHTQCTKRFTDLVLTGTNKMGGAEKPKKNSHHGQKTKVK